MMERELSCHHEELPFGITWDVCQDSYVTNPREDFDNAGTLIIWHDEGSHIGDKPATIDPNYNGVEELVDYLKRYMRARFITFVRFEDYGSQGARLYTTDEDSANGLIYVDEATMKKEWGVDRTDWLRTRVPPVLEGEVEVVDQWLQGDVYVYVIEDRDGNTLDSCGGMYGFEYAKSEAAEQAGYYVHKARENLQRAELQLSIEQTYLCV